MSSFPWLKLGVDDWLGNEAIRLLTLPERGALIDLMLYTWVRGSIPDNEGQLARLLGVTPTIFRRVWPSVQKLFVNHPTESGRLVHPGLEEQRARAEARTEVLSESGRRGAKKRWAGVAGVAKGMKPPDGHPKGEAKGQAMGRPSGGDSDKSRTDKKQTKDKASPSPSPHGGRSARLDEKQEVSDDTPKTGDAEARTAYDPQRWDALRRSVENVSEAGDS